MRPTLVAYPQAQALHPLLRPRTQPSLSATDHPQVYLVHSRTQVWGRDFDTLPPALDEVQLEDEVQPDDSSSPINGTQLPADGDTAHVIDNLHLGSSGPDANHPVLGPSMGRGWCTRSPQLVDVKPPQASTQTDDNKPPESIHKPTDGIVVDGPHAGSPLPILVGGDQEEAATGAAEPPIPTDVSYPTVANSSNTKHSNVIQDCYVRTTLDSIEYCDEPDGRTCHLSPDAIESITFETGLGTPSKLKAYCLPPTAPDTVLTSQEASMGSEQEAILLPRREVGLSGVVSTLFDNPQALEPRATATFPPRDVRTTRRRAQRHRTNARRRKPNSRRRKRKSHEDEQRPKRVRRKSRKEQHRSRQTGVSTQVASSQVNIILRQPTYLDITTGSHCLGATIDEYKSNSSYFTSVESILDTTIKSIETNDGTIADSAAAKAQTSPESTTSPHIGLNIVDSFDNDQSYVDANFVADSEINGSSSDSTTIEEVDVYKIIDSFATLMESKLDEMFDFMKTFDRDPTSHRIHHGDRPPTALKLHSLERDIVDPLLINSIHVTPDLSPSFKASEARNHPSIALALPSDPYWKPSEKDGERPQKDRECWRYSNFEQVIWRNEK